MTFWNDWLIASALDPGPRQSPIAYVPEDRAAVFSPIDPSQIQPASLDVRLYDRFVTHPGGAEVIVGPDKSLALAPGECILASLVEAFAIPDDTLARIEGKSSWARHFLTVHSAGFIDPGFRGDVTLELKNDGWDYIRLTPGVTIAQVSFSWLSAPARRPYGSEGLQSHYQNQKGPTESWL